MARDPRLEQLSQFADQARFRDQARKEFERSYKEQIRQAARAYGMSPGVVEAGARQAGFGMEDAWRAFVRSQPGLTDRPDPKPLQELLSKKAEKEMGDAARPVLSSIQKSVEHLPKIQKAAEQRGLERVKEITGGDKPSK